MKKAKRRYGLRLSHRVNSFVLLFFCLIFAGTALVSLRDNNKQMISLRSAVFTADKENGNIEGALTNLRQYVYAHMNTNLSSGHNTVKPPIQLKYEYERLGAATKAKYEADAAKVVADATTECLKQVPGADVSLARYACARAYGAAHPVTLQTIPEDLYKFDFVSPIWSPDLAGWSLLAAAVFAILFVIRFLSSWAIKRELQENV